MSRTRTTLKVKHRRRRWHKKRLLLEPLEQRLVLSTIFTDMDATTGANNGSSWANAYVDLQAAMASANAGDEIWVAEGTYKPTSGTDRAVSFNLKTGVELYGGFVGTETSREQRDWTTNVTTLSGDIGTPDELSDNTYHVVYASGVNSATLDGFSVTAGNAIDAEWTSGGGMFNYLSSPTLTNVTFGENTASAGGGMYNYYDSWPTLVNVTFDNNSAVGNAGGGMYNAGPATLTNVSFVGNSANSSAGGGLYNRLTPGLSNQTSLTNVVFSENSAKNGGGLYNHAGWPTLTNVTFSGNAASEAGGGMSNGEYYLNRPTLTNSIVWGNTASVGSQIYDSASSIITYSNVEGGWSGAGNISAAPLFVDVENGDLHLLPGSPAIDAGTASGAPSFDLDNNTRPIDGNGDATPEYDMGAYEFVPVEAVNDSYTTDEDVAIVMDVLSNDSGPGTLTIESFTQPDDGIVTDDGNGTLTFTPDENFYGETSFEYTLAGDAASTTVYDAAGEFSESSNSESDTWSYRTANDQVRDGAYSLLPSFDSVHSRVPWSPGPQSGSWVDSRDFVPFIARNDTDLTQTNGNANWPADSVLVHPGQPSSTGLAVVSWLAPADGTADISFGFSDRDNGNGLGSWGDGIEWFVDLNNASGQLATGQLLSLPNAYDSYASTLSGVAVHAGDRLNLIVSSQGDNTYDYTQIDATIALTTLTTGAASTASVSVTVNPVNDLPTVAVAQPDVAVNEGTVAQNTGTFDDVDLGDEVTITASFGSITSQDAGNSGNWMWKYDSEDDLDTAVVITADDGNGGLATTSFDLTVRNVAPQFQVSAEFPALFPLSELLPENGGDGTAGVVFNGLNPGDTVGFSVSEAGDVNGDGFSDMAIGAPGVGGVKGAVYIVFGNAEPFPASFDLSSLDGSNGFVIGGEGRDSLGYSVSGAGDVNGDDFDDLVIGAPENDTQEGPHHVIFGHASPFAASFDLQSLNGTNGFTINDVQDANIYFVADAGDVNADGFDDLFFGAPGANDGRGGGYVVFGHAGPFDPDFDVTAIDGTNGFAISLNDLNPGDGAGHSGGAAGDINNDGFGDVVIGAVGANAGSGATYIVFGHAGPFAPAVDVSTPNGTNGFVFNGQLDSSTGYSVSTASDVNGDEIDDLLIGAMVANNASGAGYVVFGHAGPFPAALDPSSLNGTNGFAVHGNAMDYLGVSVGRAGDTNGDGINDLLLGAMGANGFAGGAYVVFGQAGSFADEIPVSMLDGSNGFAVHGITPGDLVGWSTSGVGDINGDEADDLLVGAFNANGGAGASYVVYGQPSGAAPVSVDATEIDENGTVTLSGSFTDPGTSDVHTVHIDWGDNSGIESFTLPIDDRTFSRPHQYLNDPAGTPDDYTFTVTVEDDDLGEDTATVGVTVNNVDPVAVADSASTDEDTSVTFNALTNDTDVGSLDVLSAAAENFTTSKGGHVTIAANGEVTYDPNDAFEYLPDGFQATDSFSYTVEDDDDGTAAGAVMITINGLNDLATIGGQSSGSMTEDEAGVGGALSVTDVDEGEAFFVPQTTVGSYGQFRLDASGNWTYTLTTDQQPLNAGDLLNESFTAASLDGTASQPVQIAIMGVNDAPVAFGDAATTNEDTPVVIDVLANDSDVENDEVFVDESVNGPTEKGGSVVVNPNGTVTYTPPVDFAGEDSFAYQAFDGDLNSQPATVTVTVVSAQEQLQQLATFVMDLLGDQGLGNALSVKLYHAMEQLPSHPDTAINNLNAFIHQVQAQSGKKLTAVQAAAMIEAAEAAIHSVQTTEAQAADAFFAELADDGVASLVGDDLLAELAAQAVLQGKAKAKK